MTAAFLNFRGVGYSESLADWRNSYFGGGETGMNSFTKPACELIAGDRVIMGSNQIRTVDKISAREGVLTIEWKEGEWTQVRREQMCKIAGKGRA